MVYNILLLVFMIIPQKYEFFAFKTKYQVLETWKKLKCVPIDNDDMYYGPFDVHCKQQGISHKNT